MKRLITLMTLFFAVSSTNVSWGESNNMEGAYLCKELTYTSLKTGSVDNPFEAEQVIKDPTSGMIFKLEVSKEVVKFKNPKGKREYSRLLNPRNFKFFVQGWSGNSDKTVGGIETLKLMDTGLLTIVKLEGPWVWIDRYECSPDF